jgi:hypothetical protein
MTISNKYILTIWNYRIVWISIIVGIFIYYRTLDYYKSIPRHSLLTSIIVIAWSYATLKEPLFLLVGLILLNIFGEKHSLIEIN